MNEIGKNIRRVGGYRLGLLGAAAMLHLASAAAFAQRPSAPPRDAGSLFPWIVVVGVALLTVGIAFLNPKRSHQA